MVVGACSHLLKKCPSHKVIVLAAKSVLTIRVEPLPTRSGMNSN